MTQEKVSEKRYGPQPIEDKVAGLENNATPGDGGQPMSESMAKIEYIAEMAVGLRDMSVEIDMPFLAYLFEMVSQEARRGDVHMHLNRSRASQAPVQS
ncbi:MAG: hypothetical protein V6Z86_02340 [Hyphomicrobiales bacterium]